MSERLREVIEVTRPATYDRIDPAAHVAAISGIRIYDVGQGDAICVLDEKGEPFLQIDYGGKYGNPFQAQGAIDATMPLKSVELVMLTHWDEDHWCSALRSSDARNRTWLVPRQRTSPRAARFSATLTDAFCVPEDDVGKTASFQARNGDYVAFQKIARMPAEDVEEDCNATGLAFVVVSGTQVIMLPGDAPYHRVGMFDSLVDSGLSVRAVVAFHHGSKRHWTMATRHQLQRWASCASAGDVIFSYGEDNSYGHPVAGNYSSSLPGWSHLSTLGARRAGASYCDVLF